VAFKETGYKGVGLCCVDELTGSIYNYIGLMSKVPVSGSTDLFYYYYCCYQTFFCKNTYGTTQNILGMPNLPNSLEAVYRCKGKKRWVNCHRSG
jgi:hypothetical protein